MFLKEHYGCHIENKLEGVRVDAERELTTEVQVRDVDGFYMGISRWDGEQILNIFWK